MLTLTDIIEAQLDSALRTVTIHGYELEIEAAMEEIRDHSFSKLTDPDLSIVPELRLPKMGEPYQPYPEEEGVLDDDTTVDATAKTVAARPAK